MYAPAILLGEDPWVRYTDTLHPVLIFFHGGGWVSGDRISRSLLVMPYLQQKWCVVNVDYRLADGTHASIEDCVADCKDAINCFGVSDMEDLATAYGEIWKWVAIKNQ